MATPVTLDKMIVPAINVSISTAVGALAGWATSIINPVGGAIVGFAFAATMYAEEPLKNLLPPDLTANKAHVAAAAVLGMIAGTCLATLAGYTFSIIGGIGLAAVMGATYFSTLAGEKEINNCANLIKAKFA